MTPLLSDSGLPGPRLLFRTLETDEHKRREVVFVDGQLPDYGRLIGSIGAGAEVVVLGGGDGLRQIAGRLAGSRDIDAIHILSHGEPGRLQLGDRWLDGDGVEADAALLAEIGYALADGGDILVYGCRVAMDDQGKAFVQAFASATGANVAASRSLTGSAALGGDWALEEVVGALSPRTQVLQADYPHVLATLQAGDMVVLGISEPDQTITFATLVDIPAGTVLKITDKGWDQATNAFTTSSTADGVVTWTVGSAVSAGSVFTLTLVDQVFIYQGDDSNPYFIFGPNAPRNESLDDTFWQTVIDQTLIASMIPDGAGSQNVLTNGVNAVGILTNPSGSTPATQQFDNVFYNGDTDPTDKAGWLARITDAGNWSGDDTGSGVTSIGVSSGSSIALTPGGDPSGPTTLTFTSDGAAAWTDGIAEDGEGGSIDIPDIEIEVYAFDDLTDPGGSIPGPISWQDNEWFFSEPSEYTGLTYADLATDPEQEGSKGIAIASAGGAEFQIDGFTYYNWGEAELFTNTVKGYRDGIEVASMTFDVTFIEYGVSLPMDVALGSEFDNVDDVRLYISAGGYIGDQSSTNHSINNIIIADAVAAADPAPVINGVPTQLDFTEDNDAPLDLSGVTISDSNLGGGDILVEIQASSGTFGMAATGGLVLSLTGNGTSTIGITGSLVNVHAYLSQPTNIRYIPQADLNGAGAATITVTATDQENPGEGSDISPPIAIDIAAVNDAPTATNLTQSKTATEGGSAVALDDIVVTDVDIGDTITATLTLSDPGAGTLSTGTYGSATSTFNAGTGIWTVEGSVADVNAALAAVALTPSADNDQNFTITTQIRDAAGTGPTNGTISFAVSSSNEAPLVTTSGSSAAATEGSPVVVDSGMTLSDPDNTTMASATVSITGNFQPDEDVLVFTNEGATMGNISADYAPATGVLTLTSDGATATLAQWQAALRSVAYENSSQNPAEADRTISFVVNDGIDDSSAATKTVTVTAVNDAPEVTAPGTIAVTGGTATPLTGISFVDVDAESASVTVTLSVPDGSLAAITGAGVIVSGTSTFLILTGTVGDINAFVAASNVSFTPAPGATGDVTLTVAINDGGNTGSGGPLTDTATTSLTLADGAPTVTAANISISGATGTGGAFKIGDTVTAEWDNSADGDNSPGVIDVTIDFSAFGGGSAVIATDSGGIWTATYTITSGTIDATGRNVSVSATNADGTVTTADTANATVDNEAPTVTDANISISGASGTGGEYKIGDTVTATWNDTAGGDGNSDTISGVTVDFSAFGGGSAVDATNAAGIWTATYVLAAGTIDATNLNISVTAIDNAGNATTTADATNAAVDVVRPLVTSVDAPDGTYVKDDTLTFTVVLDDVVDITGGSLRLAIDLNTGGRVYANYVSGSGTNTLTFDLVVAAGQVDDDGIEIAGLDANGATITDAVGNVADLTLQNVADTSGVLIDAPAPGGGGSTPPPDEPFLIRGTPDDDLFREIRDTGTYQGEDGRDTLVYSGARDDYSVDLLANGTVVVVGPGYRHTLQSVERLEFDDGTLIFDFEGNSAAGLYRLYGGAFDRSPDEAGLLYWTDWLDDGGSLTEAASHFLGSDEFAALYGSGLSDDEFVSLLYENVLDRPGEQAGVDYWIDYLESGGDPAKVLFFFTQLPEYVGLSMPDIENGYWVT